MSAYPVTSTPPWLKRWGILLLFVLTAELGLVVWRWMPATIPLYISAQIVPVSEKLSWYLTRASGTVAYLTLTLSTVWGLLLSTKLVKAWVPATVALAMHNTLAWIAVGLSCFHAFVLLFDSYYTYTVSNLLVPFTGPMRPLGRCGHGKLLSTFADFCQLLWAALIGAKTWRRLHYLTFAGFFMVTLHGWMTGTDSSRLLPMYLVGGNLVLFLTFYRIIDAVQIGRNKEQRHSTLRGSINITTV
ncbi:MAG: hypothetical protein R2932_08695 [Caldilineaceae bacterium]